MFNHGSKSTTYKGGVDAIGVHFGGEKKTSDSPVLEPCPEGLEHNTDGTCTVCSNGNVYLSYMDDPCGTDTPMNQLPCEEYCNCTEDCGYFDKCCNSDTNTCQTLLAMHDQGQCIEGATPCVSNNDCGENEFCNIVSITLGNPDTGTCLPIGDVREYNYNGETFWGIPYQLEWWGAENWCKALGKRMVTLADFGITYDPNYDRESENVCPTYTEEEPYEIPCPGDFWEQIKTVFGNDIVYFWTSDYDRPDSAFMVNTWGSLINQGRIQYDGWLQSPLCK